MSIRDQLPQLDAETAARLDRAAGLTAPAGAAPASFLPLHIEPTTLHVHLSPTGSDSNDGLSAASPIKTLAVAARKFPPVALPGSSIEFLLAAGTYESAGGIMCYGHGALSSGIRFVGPEMTTVKSLGSPLAVFPEQTNLGGNGGEAPSAFVEWGTVLVFSQVPEGADNGFLGKWVRITRNGVLVLPELPITISGNDTYEGESITGLRVDLPFSSFPSLEPTDLVEVVTPAVTITPQAGELILPIFGQASAYAMPQGLPGLRATFERVALTAPFFCGQELSLDRVQINMGPGVGCHVQAPIVVQNVLALGSNGDGNFRVRRGGSIRSGASAAATVGEVGTSRLRPLTLIGTNLYIQEKASVEVEGMSVWHERANTPAVVLDDGFLTIPGEYLVGRPGTDAVGLDIKKGEALVHSEKGVLRGNAREDILVGNLLSLRWGSVNGLNYPTIEGAMYAGRASTAANKSGGVWVGEFATLKTSSGALADDGGGGGGGGGGSPAFPYKQPCDAVTDNPDVRRGGCHVEGVELTFTNANPSTLTRSTGSWLADGFDVNSGIIVQGASNNQNNKFFLVSGATATTLTLAKPNGTNPTLVDETTSAATVSPTVDGNVALWENARVLDVDNYDATKRGIYVVGENAPGWLRASDADSSEELPPGTLVQVKPYSGVASTWRLNNTFVTLGSTNLEWVKQSSEVDSKLFYLDGPNNGNPNDGDVIVWNESMGRFVAGAGGGGGSFDGRMTNSLQLKQGTTVNASTDLGISSLTGNMFNVNTGAAIETIDMASDWQDGSVVFLVFTGSNIQVKSNQMYSGNKANISLTGGGDFWSYDEGDALVLQKRGSTWYELARRQTTAGLAEIVSASTLSLPHTKDTFTVTGTSEVSLISAGKIPAGKVVTLYFRDGGGTLVHGVTNDGDAHGVYLSGSVDLIWGAGDTVTLRQFANKWIEIGRSILSAGV